MEKTNFEKLRVYQLAEILADTIWEIVSGWNYLAKNTVGMQMIDAADSVGSNIAEGTGRGDVAGQSEIHQDRARFPIRNQALASSGVQASSPQQKTDRHVDLLSPSCPPNLMPIIAQSITLQSSKSAKHKEQSTKFKAPDAGTT